MTSINLQNKRILVIGGTTGIGQAIVVQTAQAGADVAFCGLSEEGAAETLAEIEKAGGKGYFEALDVSDLEKARSFTRRALDFLGGLDGLVNNVGARFRFGVMGASYEDIQNCFAVNFFPAWAVSQEVFPALQEAGGGVIINMSSIQGERPNVLSFPYNASKAALSALTKSIAIEWGKFNIRAVAIAPALIFTPLTEAYFNAFDNPEEERQHLVSHYPLGRAGYPADVASLAVYLLSDANQFITGNTIVVDGGLTAQLEPPNS